MDGFRTLDMKLAPTAPTVTAEDKRLFPIYIQILDRDSAGRCWKKTTRKLFAFDPDDNIDAARRLYESYLVRAKWMCETGCKTICSDAETSFEHWAAHILKSAVEAGKVVKPDTQDLDKWARREVRHLMDQKILQADPDLSHKACEAILLSNFPTRH